MSRLIALVAFLFCVIPPAPVAAQTKGKTTKLPEGTAELRDLRYGEHRERNTLDLFVPRSEKPLPPIIWVHGGAWQGGSKAGINPAMQFLAKGYAVAAINYRLSQHAVYPAQIQDCKEAVRLLRANAKKYNPDPDRFGVWGASAGGHLVALLGTTGGEKELARADSPNKDVSDRVQCVVDFFGPIDLTRMAAQAMAEPAGAKSMFDHDGPNSPESKLVGGPIQKNKEKAATANPITYIDKNDAPVLMIHGDSDPLVPLGQSKIFLEALVKSGVAAELIVIKGGGHGGADFGSKENLDKIETFFAKHLKEK